MAKPLFRLNLANINSFDKAIQNINRLKNSTMNLQNRIVRSTTEKLVKKIKVNAAIKLGTSWAGESIHATYLKDGNGLEIGQVWGEDYIVYIEYGTGAAGAASPNPAAPSGYHPNMKSWVYFDDKLGFVTTYGQAPRPFIRQSIEEVRATLKEGVSVEFYEWTASM